ncbi:putative Taxadien-5-alpha-ol O-acetyltransferase [Hibiscus syriacus]|uniref:Taxadien-5-alpha-ol O-acetyltransferase n=1 Tax=Hibiscus syriacus TaxID=106335 RepID=A0A6A3BZA5_HIBSY|nr:putative Taxadien-5-alpha-ol O-acetyltransferase [Hibiscus syriacus]
MEQEGNDLSCLSHLPQETTAKTTTIVPESESGIISSTTNTTGSSSSRNAKAKVAPIIIISDIEAKWLGTFAMDEDAAQAYDRAAIVLYGSKAQLNLQPSLPSSSLSASSTSSSSTQTLRPLLPRPSALAYPNMATDPQQAMQIMQQPEPRPSVVGEPTGTAALYINPSLQQASIAPAVQDPGLPVGPESPSIWSFTNDDEYPPASIWDYGDPNFCFDF